MNMLYAKQGELCGKITTYKASEEIYAIQVCLYSDDKQELLRAGQEVIELINDSKLFEIHKE